MNIRIIDITNRRIDARRKYPLPPLRRGTTAKTSSIALKTFFQSILPLNDIQIATARRTMKAAHIIRISRHEHGTEIPIGTPP